MNWIITVGIITIVAMVLFLSSSFPFNSNLAHGQLPVCPDGSQRSPNGNCELVIPLPDLPRCPNGSQRSPSGFCESTSLTNLQNCPVGYQVSATGFCVPVTNSQFVNPQTALTQPQATFAQPSSSALTSSLVSPSLINPPAGQLSPWFP